MFLVIFLSLLTFKLSSPDPADTNTLIHTHIVWRHGDRTPLFFIPTDPGNGPESWTEGCGELSRKGIEQEYHLGELIRQRYTDFLPQQYNGREFYVYSSNLNRTLMSGQAVLAGMFPRDGETPMDRVNPIPIHNYVPIEQDRVRLELRILRLDLDIGWEDTLVSELRS
jgi:hypothetical protein